jgi:glycosyltransferase involved in cell wall biosynthesis
MRIGVVTTSYPRWPDDPAGGFVAEHVRWLVDAGHEVEVIAAGSRECDAAPAPDGVRVIRVPSSGDLFYAGGAPEALAAGRWSAVHAARFSAAVIAAIARRAGRWDSAIAHWLAPSALAAALAGHGRPLLAIAHSGDVHLLCRTGLATPAFALLRARRAEVVFVSSALRARFARAVHPRLRAGVEAAAVCSMGIDAARFRRAAEAAASSSEQGRSTVLVLGRLVPVKGVAVAIDAAAQWRCGARLVVAGSGPDEAALRERARAARGARVEFVGEVRGPARDRLLASARALVIPSVHVESERTEGMPVVALEAMAARVPVIASRVGGLVELPPAAVTLVEPRSSAALAEAVDRLAGGDDEAARSLQIRAAEEAAAQRDWSVVGPVFAAKLR